ncbi:hypothetical protein [Mesorhizobium australicum]|uniref:hypothetical protein n=1 Tax=Mesorhizobium australicum TaxID=536018 RepID=UPI00333526B1
MSRPSGSPTISKNAPELSIAGELARRFAAVIRGHVDAGLEQWTADATNSDLASLAAGIGHDIEAVVGGNHPSYMPQNQAPRRRATPLGSSRLLKKGLAVGVAP